MKLIKLISSILFFLSFTYLQAQSNNFELQNVSGSQIYCRIWYNSVIISEGYLLNKQTIKLNISGDLLLQYIDLNGTWKEELFKYKKGKSFSIVFITETPQA